MRLIAISLSAICCAIFMPLKAVADHDVFRFNNSNEIATVDPTYAAGVYERNIVLNIFEGLTTYHPKTLKPVEGVAERWEKLEGGHRYRFYLRKNAYWSNGRRVTAHDFVYAWLRLLKPKTKAPYAYQLFAIKNARAFHRGDLNDASKVGIRAKSDTVFEVVLDYPLPYFLQLTSFYPLLPLPAEAIEEHGDSWILPGKIVSNGPFLFNRWRKGRDARLVKNSRYWDAKNVSLKAVHIHFVNDADRAIQMYANGALDYTGETALPEKQVTRFRYLPDYHTAPWFGVNYLRFNTKTSPFQDGRVRQAWNLLLDKRKITDFWVKGEHRPARSMTPEGVPGYIPPKCSDFNVEAGEKLLRQAGYCVRGDKTKCRSFPKIRFLFPKGSRHLKMVLGIQQMIEEVLGKGTIRLVQKEWKDYLQNISDRKYEVARSGWVGDYLDPNTFLDLWVSDGSQNQTGWSHLLYDDKIAAASTMQDPKKRMQLLAQAEMILMQEMPVLPIYNYTKRYLLKPYVHGLYDNLRRVLLLKYLSIEH